MSIADDFESENANHKIWKKIALYRIGCMQYTISELDAIRDVMPGLLDRKDMRRFHAWVSQYDHHLDEHSGLPTMGHTDILHFCVSDRHKHSTELFLQEYQTYNTTFQYSAYNHDLGLSRIILNKGMVNIGKQYDGSEETIDFDSLEPYSERKHDDKTRKLHKDLKSAQWFNSDMELMGAYHNTQRPGVLKDIDKRNFRNTLETLMLDASKNERELDLLWNIHYENTCYYTIGKHTKDAYDYEGDLTCLGSKSPRLSGDRRQQLRRDCNHLYFKGCIELDINSCHGDVVASTHKAAMPFTNALMAQASEDNKISLWCNPLSCIDHRTLYHDTGETLDGIKDIIKSSYCSYFYGKSRGQINTTLVYGKCKYNDNDVRTSVEIPGLIAYMSKENAFIAANSILNTVAFKEVEIGSNEMIQDIIANSGIMGAYGWLSLEDFKGIKSLIACYLQEYECALIASIYKLAIKESESKNRRFDIGLNMFDGITIQLVDVVSKDAVIESIRKVVKNRGKELGIHANIKSKEL